MWFLFLSIANSQPMNTQQVLDRHNYILPTEQQLIYEQLTQKAQTLQLAEQTIWQRLLHYEKKFKNRYVSDQDGEYFFRSAEGKTNPSAELNATLKDLLMPVERFENQNYHPQCMFPARFSWLDRHLDFSQYNIPTVFCSDLMEWEQNNNIDTISLGFAGYYEGNPASLFGHTFLLLKSKDIDGKTLYPLISFGTEVPPNTNPLLLIINGVLGRYSGVYTEEPYYERIKKYGRKELRNIWEYDLNYTEEEKQLLLQHLWELGVVTDFNYFFFTKNCSYQLLTVLEMPREDLDLSSQFPFWVAPAETIRTVQAVPNFVESVHFRPSLRQAFDDYIEEKDTTHRKQIKELYDGTLSHDTLSSQGVDQQQQTELIDAALLLIQIDIENKEKKLDQLPKNARSLLLARNAIDAPKTISTTPYTIPIPSRGHHIRRINAFAGISDGSTTLGLRWRPSFHSASDPQTAYPMASQQEVFLDLRYQPTQQHFYIEKASLYDIQYFTPPEYTQHFGSGWGVQSQLLRDPLLKNKPTLWENAGFFYKTIPLNEKGLLYGAIGLSLPVATVWDHWINVKPILKMGTWLYPNNRIRVAGNIQLDGYAIDITTSPTQWYDSLYLRTNLQISTAVSERFGIDLIATDQHHFNTLYNGSVNQPHQELLIGMHHFF